MRFVYHLLFNMICILSIEVIPVLIGRVFFSVYNIPSLYLRSLRSSIALAVNEHKLIVSELVLIWDLSSTISLDLTEEAVFERCVAAMEAVCGYAIIFSTVFSIGGILLAFKLKSLFPTTRVLNVATAYIRNVMGMIHKWIVVSAILMIEMIILPQIIGWLIDIALLPAFSSTLKDRLNFWYEMPVICAVVHWLVGFIFIFGVAMVLLELREIIRSDLLVGLLPIMPQASQASLPIKRGDCAC